MLRNKRPQEKELFSAQAATGDSDAVDVADHKTVVVAVTAAANSTLTFKFRGSVRSTAPDFTAAQSTTNVWDYVGVYDLEDGSFIDGDTGVTINNDTAANNTRQYLVNIEYLQYFGLEVSAYTDGSLSAWLMSATD